MKSSPLVWFITGASQGFGLELVRAALQRGDSVVATSRTPKKLEEIFPNTSDRLLALALDLHDPAAIEKAAASALSKFGQIDFLVNNAGYGLLGTVEEASDAEVLEQFQINFFGLLRVTRAVLPHFRERRSGHIVNISSMCGLTAWGGSGIYSATKFAVEGLSETLAEEVAPFGIRVMLVEPGGFRTNFLGDSLKLASNVIDDYTGTDADLRDWSKNRHGKQSGDPALAAQAIIKAITSEKPPLHLLLGRDAYEEVTKKLDTLHHEIEEWRDMTLSMDFA